MLQERIVFFVFDELIADADAIHQMNFFQLMRYSNIEVLYLAISNGHEHFQRTLLER